MEKNIIEQKLDEADLQAKNNKNRLTHEEVFSDIHKHLTQQQFNFAIQKGYDEMLTVKGRKAKNVLQIF